MTLHADARTERELIWCFMAPGQWYRTSLLRQEMMIPRSRLFRILERMDGVEWRRAGTEREWMHR